MLAVIQLSSQRDLNANLIQIDGLLAKAAQQGAKLALLPEMCLTLDASQYQSLAKSQAPIEALAKLAQKYQLYLIAGAVPQPSPDGDARVRSASLVFDEKGQLVARYDKRHLFDADVADKQGRYRESASFSPGTEYVLVDTPMGKLGLAICFDLRFGEHFTRLREMGAEIISLPAAFTYNTGQAHWEVLLRARAIETQCYVIAANQCGWHDEKRQTWGHSQIIDPWGRVLGELAEEVGVLVCSMDSQEQAKIRKQMPLFRS